MGLRSEHCSPAAISGNVRFHGSIWKAPLRRRGGFYIRPCNLGQRKTSRANSVRPYKTLFQRSEPLSTDGGSVCQKTIFPVVETVGSNIFRPETWRSNVFSGRFLTRQTGTGAQCAPLQCTFTLVGCFINNADGKDTVGTVDTVDDGHHQRLVGEQGDVLGSNVCMGACSIAQRYRGGDDYGVGWLRLFAAVDASASIKVTV